MVCALILSLSKKSIVPGKVSFHCLIFFSRILFGGDFTTFMHFLNSQLLVMVPDRWLFSKPELSSFLDMTDAFDKTLCLDWSF